MLWLQGTRVDSLTDADARLHLENVANETEAQTDQLDEEYDLLLARRHVTG
jgi:hypothetical protein